MKANELRIGNYVQYEEQNPYVIEDGKDIDASVIYHAIPLTERWLVKLGFKYQDRDVSHGKGHIERFYISPYFGEHREYWLELQLNDNVLKTYFAWLMWDIGGGRNFIHLPCGHKLEYVHQLQNLYFALTGEELEIKK